MINEENLKNIVRNKLQAIADNGYKNFSEKIENEFKLHFFEISKSLEKELNNIYSQYEKLKKAGKVGKLEWIYLSFLYTSFLDHSPSYQIDFYDSRDRISEIECTGTWDFKFIYDCYYHVEQELLEELNRQTRLKKHEINEMLSNLQQKFRRLADARIPPVIKNSLNQNKEILINENNIKLMLGEFLDKSKLIMEWEAGIWH